jgi:hypothetical protein
MAAMVGRRDHADDKELGGAKCKARTALGAHRGAIAHLD